ncbi:MAG: hypothetical protein ACKPKO_49135, partial [Candidatus Fonsibacter sp.]
FLNVNLRLECLLFAIKYPAVYVEPPLLVDFGHNESQGTSGAASLDRTRLNCRQGHVAAMQPGRRRLISDLQTDGRTDDKTYQLAVAWSRE